MCQNNLGRVAFNVVRSLKLSNARSIALYADKDRGGDCITIYGDTDRMPGTWKDVPTSFALNAACSFDGAVTLYDERGLRGRARGFDADASDLGDLDDKASAVWLRPGVTAALFKEPGFRGACLTVAASVAQLGGTVVGSDSVSSLWVGRSCPAAQVDPTKGAAAPRRP